MKLLDFEDVKEIQLNILQNVHDFCMENDIIYFLDSGTLIGAIRHDGYIPWDDDIDICMTRNQYREFAAKFNKSSSRYKLVNHDNNPAYPYEFAKIVDTETVLIENVSNPYKLGINIDLFILDKVPNDEKILNKIDSQIKLLNIFLQMKYFKVSSIGKSNRVFKIIATPFIYFIRLFYSVNFIIEKMLKIHSLYENCDSDYYAWTSNRFFDKKMIFKSEWFDEILVHKFENREFYIPVGYDEYLRTVYGDYLELPPENQRVTHHSYKAYLK